MIGLYQINILSKVLSQQEYSKKVAANIPKINRSSHRLAGVDQKCTHLPPRKSKATCLKMIAPRYLLENKGKIDRFESHAEACTEVTFLSDEILPAVKVDQWPGRGDCSWLMGRIYSTSQSEKTSLT